MRLSRVWCAAIAPWVGAPAAAQDMAEAQKPPSQQERIAAQIDRYLQNPRSAATYRALANMGDPDFMSESQPYYSRWDSSIVSALGLSGSHCRWQYADETYRKRVARYRQSHPYVRQWLNVQKAVFSRCNGWGGEREIEPIPPAMATGDRELALLQAEDRAYQAAAALFYENKRKEARARFAAIAARPVEHQAAAKLMVAAIDAGSGPDTYSSTANPAAIAEAERLIRDPAAKPMQANAHELVGWIGATANTREARRAQVKVTLDALMLPLTTIDQDDQAAARYARSSEDLLALFTDFKDDGWWVTGAVPAGYFGSLAMSEAAKTNALAAFALTQRPSDEAPGASAETQHAAWERYNAAKPDRDAWRVVLIQLGSYWNGPATSWAEIDALLAKVAARPTDHDVALLGFLYDHQMRQALSGGGYPYDEADSRRGQAVAMLKLATYPYKKSEHFLKLYSEGLNSFIAAKNIEFARRLRDLVEPQLDDETGYSWLVDSDMLLLLAEDEAAMFRVINDHGAGQSTLLNRLPARELARLAADERLDPKLRKRFARVAWTRNFVLGRKIPKQLDATMRTLNPELKWQSRPGSQPKDHELLLDVINTPGMNLRIESRADTVYGPADEAAGPMQIDVYQHSLNNWWCAPDAIEQNEREEDAVEASVDKIPRRTLETLLAKSYVWQSLDREERAALSAIPNGARFLSEAAIAWGNKASARKPEGADQALALAVRTTRYGCQFNGNHAAYSKAAWDLLHQKFPLSDAAKRTRWWFSCKHFTYGCTDSMKDDQIYVDLEALEAELNREQAEREAKELKQRESEAADYLKSKEAKSAEPPK